VFGPRCTGFLIDDTDAEAERGKEAKKMKKSKNEVISRLLGEKQELDADSRAFGCSLGYEYLEDGTLDYSIIRRLNGEWKDSRGYEPWNNLLGALGTELEEALRHTLEERLRDGDDFTYDEVAAGFFESAVEVWADLCKQQARG